MRAIISVITLSLLLSVSTATSAERTDFDKINTQVIALYIHGNYNKALLLAEESLKIAEQNFGSKHPNTAKPLNNLALLCKTTGK